MQVLEWAAAHGAAVVTVGSVSMTFPPKVHVEQPKSLRDVLPRDREDVRAGLDKYLFGDSLPEDGFARKAQ